MLPVRGKTLFIKIGSFFSFLFFFFYMFCSLFRGLKFVREIGNQFFRAAPFPSRCRRRNTSLNAKNSEKLLQLLGAQHFALRHRRATDSVGQNCSPRRCRRRAAFFGAVLASVGGGDRETGGRRGSGWPKRTKGELGQRLGGE